ncbi:MAG: hypothetical protein ABFE07_28405 [Armatimonadia bacterium]
MNDLVCPSCGNHDMHDFRRIYGGFTVASGELDELREEVRLYGCRRCSTVIVQDWRFRMKDPPEAPAKEA